MGAMKELAMKQADLIDPYHEGDIGYGLLSDGGPIMPDEEDEKEFKAWEAEQQAKQQAKK